MTVLEPELLDPAFLDFVAQTFPEEVHRFTPLLREESERADFDWSRYARPEQLPPKGEWLIWFLLTGRRWGKTRSAAEWMRVRALGEAGSYAICAPTYGDVRDVCVEGGQKWPANRRSGLLSVCAPGEVENYNRSLGEIRMRNGSKIKMLSADEPDRARGWGFNAAWCIAGGSLVQTDRGTVAIERIVAGDRVWTRKGLRRVSSARQTGTGRPVLRITTREGDVLRCTPDHRVWADGSWKRADEVAPGSTMAAWRYLPILSLDHQRGLSGRDFVGTEIRRMAITASEADSCFTWRFGRKNTGQCLPDSMSTTKTTIAATTRSATLRQSPTLSIVNTMVPLVPTQHGSATSRRRRQRSGRGDYGTRRFRDPVSASNVGSNFLAEPPSSNSVQRHVVRQTVVSAVEPDSICDVYDLTIEDAHEFFAGGLLVHNCDELSSWRYPATWHETLLPAVTMSDRHRFVITTTPKVNKLTRDLVTRAGEDPSIVLVRGRTAENAANLGAGAVDELQRQMTARLARQELEGELLLDVPGALATYAQLDGVRVTQAPELVRKVVWVDPAVTNTTDSDETGITLQGRGVDGDCYLLADRSCRTSVDEWADIAVILAVNEGAGMIGYEPNQGGDAIGAVLKTAMARLGVTDIVLKDVPASKSKFDRALPLQQAIEQQRWHPVGSFPEMEEQLTGWTIDSPRSPDRLDSAVHGFTELMLTEPKRRPRAVFRG